MRILADENFPKIVVDGLREKLYDVVWIRSDSPGISDKDILAKAQRKSVSS